MVRVNFPRIEHSGILNLVEVFVYQDSGIVSPPTVPEHAAKIVIGNLRIAPVQQNRLEKDFVARLRVTKYLHITWVLPQKPKDVLSGFPSKAPPVRSAVKRDILG